ncbi:Ger(x)C family spore germination protein [Saliterribacillus persicus]|uniref:Ger(X)C family germination protein n=1 Tax=Saliterribacillus persicus TaxID=930114 RepID=A0A368XA60_9BACI|nr:Ger(x)C family spore germination protein [Saliterribacillus persicus]RCW64589.1 Ger(x)C family germination protein [Saliterribacillus persicus]
MRKKNIFLICIFIMVFPSGCNDRQELEQQSYVVAIGVDKAEEEDKYDFTYQIANPEVGSSSSQGGTNEPPSEIVTITGNDVLTATYTANAFVSKKITLDHTKVIIVSEELARDENFLRVLQAAARTPQIRRGVELIVSKEKAREFIQLNKPVTETRPHKYFLSILNRVTRSGLSPNSELHRFFQITEGDADLFLSTYASAIPSEEGEGNEDEYLAGQIPKLGGSPTQFMGAAVFKEGIMIDTLNGHETRLVNILDPTMDIENFITTFKDPIEPKFRVSIGYSQDKDPNISITYNKDKPSLIEVTVDFKAEVIAIPSLVDYSQNPDYQKRLINQIISELEEQTNKLIEKSQKEYGTDPFYWSLFVRKHFLDVKAYEKADWNKVIYPNAKIKVRYNLQNLEFGKMLNDTSLEEVRD